MLALSSIFMVKKYFCFEAWVRTMELMRVKRTWWPLHYIKILKYIKI